MHYPRATEQEMNGEAPLLVVVVLEDAPLDQVELHRSIKSGSRRPAEDII